MLGLQQKLIIGFAAAAVVAGSFGMGWVSGKSRAEIRYIKVENKALEKWASMVSDLSNSFISLAEASARQRATVREHTTSTISSGTRYVQEKIPEAVRVNYDLPNYLVELRLCNVDALYKTAGAELPAERKGKTCPPPVPE